MTPLQIIQEPNTAREVRMTAILQAEMQVYN